MSKCSMTTIDFAQIIQGWTVTETVIKTNCKTFAFPIGIFVLYAVERYLFTVVNIGLKYN